MKYSEYTYTTQTPHYGDGYSADELATISTKLEAALVGKFPGLNFVVSHNGGASTPTRGPDDDVIQDIERAGSRAFDSIVAEIG